MIHESLVKHVDEGVVLDVRREVKLSVRCLDAPFLLQLGGGFPIVCEGEVLNQSVCQEGRGKEREKAERDGRMMVSQHILDSSKYLSSQVSEVCSAKGKVT